MNTLKFGNGEWYGKKDTILAYNDENSNYKPLPFDFSRDSSATVVNADGLIETVGSGQPRIDYKDDSKGALLLEPQRSNYQPYSTVFSSWGVVDVTVGLNYGLSPDGFNNSVLITEGTGSTQHRILKGSPASSGIYTLSCFVKNKVGNRQAYIDMGAVTGFFNFDTETMFSAAGTTSVESWSNGWYRISITSNTNVTPTVNYLGTGKNNSETFQGDGSSAIEFFAPQLEVGSYPTSYIPTQGSAVTRLRDKCLKDYFSILTVGNSYTLFFDVDLNEKDDNKTFFNIKNTSDSTSFTVRSVLGGVIRVYNNLDSQYPTGNLASSTSKWVVRIDGTSFKIFGAEGSLSGTLTTARDMGEGIFGRYTQTKINDFKVYNTALSDSECEALTQV